MGEEFTITKYDRDTYAARMGIADDLGRGADPVCERIAMIDAAVAHLPSRIQENATLRAALNLFGGEVVGVKPRPAKQPAKEDEEQAPTEAAQAPATEATQTHEEPPSQTPQPRATKPAARPLTRPASVLSVDAGHAANAWQKAVGRPAPKG